MFINVNRLVENASSRKIYAKFDECQNWAGEKKDTLWRGQGLRSIHVQPKLQDSDITNVNLIQVLTIQ